MDPNNDIRRLHDVAGAPAAVAWLLQNRPPPKCSEDQVGYETSGLDCLLILIRMLYSVQLPIYTSNEHRLLAAEARNPALRLAWQNYTYEPGESQIMWARAKEEVLDVFKAEDPEKFDTSFDRLVDSPLMEETLWCRPEYQLYRYPLVKFGPGRRVVHLPDTYRRRTETIIIDRPLMSSRPTFQQYIDDTFRCREQRDGSKILKMVNEPSILRIPYSRPSYDDPVFPFSTLKDIYLPVADFDGETYTEVARRPHYTLIAAVGLRDDEGPFSDLVRTYSPMANQLIPMPSNPVLDGKWTLETGYPDYIMLYYLYMGNVEPHEGLARSDIYSDIRFGHAQSHPHTLENVALWKYLFAARSSLDPAVIVASPIELIAVRSAAALSVQEGLLAFTYQEFLDFIEAKPRDGTRWDPQVWSEVWQSDHLTVMVAVEPHMPVDCALAFTMVTRWAATRPPTLGVRILTVSTEEHHPEMVALLESQGIPEPQRFLILGLSQVRWKETVQIVSCNESNLAERVKSTIMRNNGQQVVIYFRSTVPLLEVFRDLNEKGWLAFKIDPSEHPDQVSRLMTAGALPSRALRVVEEFRSPFPLIGFDQIHIVLSSTSSKKVFDSVSRQIIEVVLPLSKQEKQEQLAWAYRWRGNPTTISVYIDHPTLPEFLDAGDPHRLLHVNNKQLGGFLSALASFDSWGIDPLRTARCFALD
ncbi:hypothetical protein CDV31_005265 [Fusarium ambrosium]|uniref:Uncharacterized protein n=1 Tax=Fusarium ambrosium TaxID=131363 RepID=A0A428UKI7_9HYPO|nr:hypothetical protein CDV31_005265 [Fusarium ambrosium]